MRWLWPAMVWLAWAGAAVAQTVTVRGGEHADFSRLVFGLPERIEYEVARADGEVRITFGRSGLQWRTETVFERVPKDRLTALEALPGAETVTLSLDCDCEIETFWHGAAYLVIDIRDPSDSAEAAPDPAEASMRLPPAGAVRERPGTAARMVSGALDGMQPAKARSETEKPEAVAALAESRDRLVRQIGRAASQGLLSPDIDMMTRPEPVAEAREGPVREPDPPVRPVLPNIQLHAETSIDRDLETALFSRLGPNAATACLAPDQVNVADWGGPGPFHEQIGRYRARLVGEFDRPERAAVLGLARAYVHFGFGAEAKQVLRQMRWDGGPEPVLEDLADIVETGHAGPASSLSGQMTCAPMVALWSALSYATIPRDEPVDGGAILQGFSALPTHLRAHLGPGLARRLATRGHDTEARRIRRILDRTPEAETSEGALLEAEIALDEEKGEAGEAALETIIADNAEPSPEALLRLIRHRLDRDAEISYETAQLAGAYAHEHRGQPLEPALTAAYLSALAASGAFDEAFGEFSRLSAEDEAADASLRSSLVGLLTRRADDYAFLQHVLAAAGAPDGLDAETANAAAARLLALGFADAAGTVAPPGAGDERKLLRAEIALRQGRPRRAEAELVGLTGAGANGLRAEARSMIGEHEAASRLFAGVGREGDARREAWLAEDWPALAGDDDAARAGIARLKLAAPEVPGAANEGVLARDRVLVDRSLETRDAVRALLEANPVPPE